MTHDEYYERFAAVVAAVGLNIQPDQEVYVRAPIETASFVPHFVRAAYARGAKYVHVDYRHQAVTRARLESAPAETLAFVPPGEIEERLRVARDGGASLVILGEDPTGLAGVPVDRRATWKKAYAEATSGIRELTMRDHYPWCVISIPNPVWAAAVYSDAPAAEALDRLFSAVAHACRLDTPDPVAAWSEHTRRLLLLARWLTAQAFDRFEYRAPGTELSVGMPDGQQWLGAEAISANQVTFLPNLPTDEVFSAPHRDRVSGTVRSTRPLILGGTNVGFAEFTVEAGRIVKATCEREQAVLDSELDLDDGARFFGEIALVTEDAPVAELGTTFFDGLYDENAGCHLAFGNAYANCVAGGAEMDDEARAAAGLNTSKQHHDFTVGSDELRITAVRRDGSEFPLMEKGRWTGELAAAVGW